MRREIVTCMHLLDDFSKMSMSAICKSGSSFERILELDCLCSPASAVKYENMHLSICFYYDIFQILYSIDVCLFYVCGVFTELID